MSFTIFFLMTMLFLYLQTVVYHVWSYSRLDYSRSFSKEAVFAGEEVQLIERIANRKWLPLLWVHVESGLHPSLYFINQEVTEDKTQQYHTSLFSMPPFMKITRTHRIICKQRGAYLLKSVSIVIGDPLGIKREYRYLPISGKLLVYPKVIPIEEMPLSVHTELGDWLVKRWILPDPFLRAGVRAYQYGDSQKSIHWNATARANSLQVHQFDFTANQRLMIYVDFVTSDEIWDAVTKPEQVEEALSMAASIAQYALSQGMEVGFGCNAQMMDGDIVEWVRISPGVSNEQMNNILTIMAQLLMQPSGLFSKFLEAEYALRMSNWEMLILTCHVSQRTEVQIELLKALGNHVSVLHMNEVPA